MSAPVKQNSFAAAETELRTYKARHGLLRVSRALSWMARARKAGQWTGSGYATETRSLAEKQLAKRKLDAEPHLPLALGALTKSGAGNGCARKHAQR